MALMIIAEKPAAALKIAIALAEGKIEKKSYKGVRYYKITRGGKEIYIVSAVGHLFGLKEDAKGWIYPVFEISWKPIYTISKNAKFTKPYFELIKNLSKNIEEFYNGCDLDIEGELIFKNILNFICKRNDARRMRFSTLTKSELIKAFENSSEHIDFGLAEAGETRHFLDHYYGITLTRALTLAIKSAGMFKILSTGRVQGPTLKILAKREKEIMNFKPKPFWQIEIITGNLSAWHKKDKFWNVEEAEEVIKKIRGKKAVIKNVTRKEYLVPPPNPFDLTTLQIEAYKAFKITPKETLSIAQNLYTNSYISYPRTSSNILPSTINFKRILAALAAKSEYSKFANKLLGEKYIKPNNGKKKDPAHPAIYPTEEPPKELKGNELKVYDLIVRRFLSTFYEAAKRERQIVEIEIGGESFIVKGSRTIDEGWLKVYKRYLKTEEIELPQFKEGQTIEVGKINLHERETQPPKRYTPASIIKELEKRSLGTKATRSEILDNLFKRDYLKDTAIRVTNLGLKTVEVLEKFCPAVLDEELTRKFERELEEIREGKKKKEEVLNEAIEVLKKIASQFKENEKKIGEELIKAYKETMEKETIIGKCKCGGNLKIIYSKKTKKYFIACTNYPKCKINFSLPRGLPKPTGEVCQYCGYPLVIVIRKGKRPWKICINPECESKKK